MTAKEMAHSIVKEATDATAARQQLIKQVAEKLSVNLLQAESLIRQEEARKEASKKYRESEAYKKRLQQQKLVRAMLK